MYVKRQQQRGYTLIELMIVVLIVMSVMAAAGPAFGNAFADRRSANATQDVVQLGRRAFHETVAYHRAHVVWFSGMSGSDGGRVELIRGDNNSCRQDWDALRKVDTTCGASDSRCIAWVDLNGSPYLTGGRGPRLRSSVNQVAICYQPDGTTAHASSLTSSFLETNLDSSGNSLAGGYQFNMQSYDSDGSAEGVARHILYPLGGLPRRQR